MTHLIYFLGTTPKENATPIETPFGTRYIRVLPYRGGRDPIDFAYSAVYADEEVLNSIEERAHRAATAGAVEVA